MNPIVVIVAGIVWAGAWSFLSRLIHPTLSPADEQALHAAHAEQKRRTT